MAPQVDYPGVYIEEFTPGAPIEGVSTSTAAFIGTAERGPSDLPKLVQSWDAFKEIFGNFISGPATGYLGPAVYGFFLNGGKTCFVLRHSTGKMATIQLLDRSGGTQPALVATALQEGTSSNALTIQVSVSSILATALQSAGVVKTTLNLITGTADVTNITPEKTRLTVSTTAGFARGDSVILTDSKKQTENATISNVNDTKKTIDLTGPVDSKLNFAGASGKINTANLRTGDRVFRLDVPANLTLSSILPRGSTIHFQGKDTSSAANSINEYCTIESVGGDQVTISSGLKNSYSMVTGKVPEVASLEFDLVISDPAKPKNETFIFLGMDPNHPNYWRTSVTSQLVSLDLPQLPSTADDPRPLAGSFASDGKGSSDVPATAWTEITGNTDLYLNYFNSIPDISLMCIPGATGKDAQQKMIAHCEQMANRFAILDPGEGRTVDDIPDQLAGLSSQKGYAALYFPWILANNPVRNQIELWPPSGHIAGIYALTDFERGVHKAPANLAIRGALGLKYQLTNKQQGPLNLKGINVLRVFQAQAQPMVWGARTIATDKNWQYVNIRRLFIFLERSIEEGIRLAVFEPNNLQLWQKLKRTITEFLTRVWREGALFGETAEKAFYVRIDETLNPDSTRRLGRLYIEIGVCPAYPAEFIIVRIGIWQGGFEIIDG